MEKQQIDIDNIKRIKQELNKCNFGKNGIIELLNGDCENQCYCADKTDLITGFCTDCENQHYDGPNGTDLSGYSLKNISHGAHTLDFFYSQYGKDWEKKSVIFLSGTISQFYSCLKTQAMPIIFFVIKKKKTGLKNARHMGGIGLVIIAMKTMRT